LEALLQVPFLLSRFADERTDSVRQMLALALGATGYQPSADLLIKALSDKSEVLRGCAAWSLGKLKVRG
jgi:HEAT repeat protein